MSHKKIFCNHQCVMTEITFVKYTGKYPTLCFGTLVIKVDDKQYRISGWNSGGNVWFDDEWNAHVDEGDWTIDMDDIPDELKHLHKEIVQVMNDNVEKGCCGGCI